jgi:hypothetical protein
MKINTLKIRFVWLTVLLLTIYLGLFFYTEGLSFHCTKISLNCPSDMTTCGNGYNLIYQSPTESFAQHCGLNWFTVAILVIFGVWSLLALLNFFLEFIIHRKRESLLMSVISSSICGIYQFLSTTSCWNVTIEGGYSCSSMIYEIQRTLPVIAIIPVILEIKKINLGLKSLELALKTSHV